MDSQKLEKRAWYRLMKVLLVLIGITWCLLVAAVTVIGSAQSLDTVQYVYQVNCYNPVREVEYTKKYTRSYDSATFTWASCDTSGDMMYTGSKIVDEIQDTDYLWIIPVGTGVAIAGLGLLLLTRWIILYVVYGHEKPPKRNK